MEEITAGAAAQTESFDYFVWPLCESLASVDGCWVAPRIPQSVLIAALATYLDLADDETLLAVVDGGTQSSPAPACSLTTKRVYWREDPLPDDASRDDRGRPGAASGAPPTCCAYVEYAALPDTIRRRGAAVDLGEGREIALGAAARSAEALVRYLTEARARVRGEVTLAGQTSAATLQAESAWRNVKGLDAAARQLQARIRARQAEYQNFETRTSVAARAVITRVLAAACALVFVLMVARGVSPSQPRTDVMVAWGAIYGPAVVFDGQFWRLLTAQFLHYGFLHLAMNLWCLLSVGPRVERFFGHLGFAALYLLSGTGGALASLCVHPTVVSAGASGAIFGVIGGLLAFLIVRRRDVPMSVLKPMRASTVSFVGYNLLFGLADARIDMAGHVGGLVTGFVVGLCLAASAITRPDRVGLMRRLAVIAPLASVIVLLAVPGREYTRARIPARHALDRPQPDTALALNDFMRAATPLIEQLDRSASAVDRLWRSLNGGGLPADEARGRVDQLLSDSERLAEGLAALPVRDDGIRTLSQPLLAAQRDQRQILALLKRFLAARDDHLLQGPEGLQALVAAYRKDSQAFLDARESYIKTHGLIVKQATSAEAGP